MKFSAGLPGVHRYPPSTEPWHLSLQPEQIQQIARHADELGYHRLSVPEHIVMPKDLGQLMGGFWPHALTVMAFAAGATRRIRVCSSVIVVPYHHPVVMAKAVATLDHVSGGRVDFAIGVGHAEHEFEVLGLPFHERGAMTDEYLAAMIELWTQAEPRFSGTYVAFDDIVFEPKPVQRPYPPILVGGNSKAALRRAARIGDGWYPWLITPDQLPSYLDELRSMPEFDASKPFEIVMSVSNVKVGEDHVPVDSDDGRPDVIADKQALVDAIGHLQEIGVTSTSVPLPRSSTMEEYLEQVQWVAEEIMPLFPEPVPVTA